MDKIISILIFISLLSSTSSLITPIPLRLTRNKILLAPKRFVIPPLALGRRIPINEQFPGIQKIHSSPDIFILENFLSPSSCKDLIERAKSKKLDPSPVAYAGWTDDVKELVELAAKGPVSWGAIGLAWAQTKDVETTQFDLVSRMVQNYGALLIIAFIAIGIYTWTRAEGLRGQRTSTSTTLGDLDSGTGALDFVSQAADLFEPGTDFAEESSKTQAPFFESPTVIRYEKGQVLKPHFDANRSSETEDVNRGGQTLATLLVYLNDVGSGGLTKFGSIPNKIAKDEGGTKLSVRPKMGDALLFFPADARGSFDERTEHEGCPAVDEKWIARIWKHQNRVPPPFGLDKKALSILQENQKLEKFEKATAVS